MHIRKLAQPNPAAIASFLVFVMSAAGIGLLLQFSGTLGRAELQTINQRFEARRWIKWSPESLQRLNSSKLLQYHEQSEIPRKWWAWDYTLSWLIENNHPMPANRIIIFNHLLEDEPPLEAVADHPWMKPLLTYPTPRKTMAQAVDFLAANGAKMIILDNDFPQYADGDAQLARSIHNASMGITTGNQVPVIFATTIVRRSTSNAIALHQQPPINGLLSELQKLEPGIDVKAEYTGSPSVLMDEDQVVRRMVSRLKQADLRMSDSIALKAARILTDVAPDSVPDVVDIDFVASPNSEVFPVRSFSYLLDPDRRSTISGKSGASQDVRIKDAVVIIGDGVTDLFSTPYTNQGMNLMSGSEVLANALDTLCRKSAPQRLHLLGNILYVLISCILAAAAWAFYKLVFGKLPGGIQNRRVLAISLDLLALSALLVLSYLAACILFSFANLIVPVIVPAVAITGGTVCAMATERERLRVEVLRTKLEAAHTQIELMNQNHKTQLQLQEALAESREARNEENRKREFARRLNHDLRSPATIISWTIAQLRNEGLKSATAADKVERLARTSDRLFELINDLVKSYDTRKDTPAEARCSLIAVLREAVDLELPLADNLQCSIELTDPSRNIQLPMRHLDAVRVFDNLIRNAIRHNPPLTRVQVYVADSAGLCRIYVADTGKGMNPEEVDRIFQPGYRSVDAAVEGEGLGLDIVHSLVESAGGRIEVTSEVGKGSTFCIQLPALETPPQPELQETSGLAKVPGNAA